MSKKNKCNGLDCEMCGNAKCPNEEKEKIIDGIDVSECPCKDDDKCLEVPILNEYGDLIDYQDCEPQTLCPYRSKTKIQRLQEENEKLYKALEEIRNYASVLYGEPLIDGSKIRLKSGMYRIKTKINEVLNDRN